MVSHRTGTEGIRPIAVSCARVDFGPSRSALVRQRLQVYIIKFYLADEFEEACKPEDREGLGYSLVKPQISISSLNGFLEN